MNGHSTAPASVRAAFRRGVALVDAGHGGAGLRPETVAWARRLADGAAIDEDKARRMRAWLRRHGPAKAEGARRLRDPESPAAVAWLLWGADPSIPYRRSGWADPVGPWVERVVEWYDGSGVSRGTRSNGASRVTVPAAAQQAYDAGLAYSRAVAALGGVGLPSYANTSAPDVAMAVRRGDHDAARTLTSFAAWRGGDVVAVMRALDRAVSVRLPDDVAVAFWRHGIHGWHEPRWVTAWRYGDIPEGGRSYNYRDRHEEMGVSAAEVVGGPSGFGLWQSDRPVRWIKGFWREDITGSDGEPLIVGAVRARRPTVVRGRV